jgi:hypothetical protein
MKESSPTKANEKRRHPKAGQWDKFDKYTGRTPYTLYRARTTVVHTITQPGQSLLITSVPQIAFCQGRASDRCSLARCAEVATHYFAALHLLLAIQKRASGKRYVTFCGEPVESLTRN